MVRNQIYLLVSNRVPEPFGLCVYNFKLGYSHLGRPEIAADATQHEQQHDEAACDDDSVRTFDDIRDQRVSKDDGDDPVVESFRIRDWVLSRTFAPECERNGDCGGEHQHKDAGSVRTSLLIYIGLENHCD